MSDERAMDDQMEAKLALLRAYADMFRHPAGQMVLIDLLRTGGLLAVSHSPGDPCDTAFNEGRRSLALHIVENLRLDEMQILHMARHRMEPEFDPIQPDAGTDQTAPDSDGEHDGDLL